MNTENVPTVGAAYETVTIAPEVDLIDDAREKALEIAAGTKTEAQNTNETITFVEKAKEVACEAWNSVKEFSQEIWGDEEGRKLLKDLVIAISVRLAFRHPLTAGIAIGIVGYRAWQEIKDTKDTKEAYANN